MSTKKQTIRIGLAQMNPSVGDLEGNVEKIRSTALEAKRKGIQILAFPELMLCGYPPEDLLLKPRFLQDCEVALEKAAAYARGIVLLVGAPESSGERGRNPYNTCAVLSRGRIAARYRKMHLPNYGVFDERRYFVPGTEALVARLGGLSIGLNICEDIWAEDGPTPLQVTDGGASIVFNISASPYHRRKGPERERLMQRRARQNGCYLAYVNLVGGQDELVFDGSSVIAGPDGVTIARGNPFEEHLIIADLDPEKATGRRKRGISSMAAGLVTVNLGALHGCPPPPPPPPHPPKKSTERSFSERVITSRKTASTVSCSV